MRKWFHFQEGVHFLNHGSYGAMPRPVKQIHAQWLDHVVRLSRLTAPPTCVDDGRVPLPCACAVVCVVRTCRACRAQEEQPCRWFNSELFPLISHAVRGLAKFIGKEDHSLPHFVEPALIQ